MAYAQRARVNSAHASRVRNPDGSPRRTTVIVPPWGGQLGHAGSDARCDGGAQIASHSSGGCHFFWHFFFFSVALLLPDGSGTKRAGRVRCRGVDRSSDPEMRPVSNQRRRVDRIRSSACAGFDAHPSTRGDRRASGGRSPHWSACAGQSKIQPLRLPGQTTGVPQLLQVVQLSEPEMNVIGQDLGAPLFGHLAERRAALFHPRRRTGAVGEGTRANASTNRRRARRKRAAWGARPGLFFVG